MMGMRAKALSGLPKRVPLRSAHKAMNVPKTVVPAAVDKAKPKVFQATPQRPDAFKQFKLHMRGVPMRSQTAIRLNSLASE